MNLAAYFLSYLYFASWKYIICINICVCPWSGTLWGPFLSESWSLCWMKRRATCSTKGCFEQTEMTHMLHINGTETRPASYTPWPIPGRSKACSLGPEGWAMLSCESRVYFANLPSHPHSPTPPLCSPGLWGHPWCLHPTTAVSEGHTQLFDSYVSYSITQ